MASDTTTTAEHFAGTEALGGLVLIVAAALALLVANGPLAPAYHALLARPLGPLAVHGWIDDALMSLFFLAVGLEVKRALLEGELADPRARALPLIAAAAGMAVPATLYLLLAPGSPRGWAIPAATDIAFAQGVLALAGARVRPELRLLLTSIAIADDIGAVAVIALAYTPALHLPMLAAAALPWAAMLALARRRVDALAPYLLLSALLWLAVFRSGIHPTIAGVLAATAIPLRARPGGHSPLGRLESRLHPLVSFGVLPLFAFANAGLPLAGLSWPALAAPVPLAIAAALFVGKQSGVLGGIALAARLRLAALPPGIGGAQLYGVALLCGIGFTMSLFIGGLAFPRAEMDAVRLGVLAGSLLSAVAGLIVLRLSRS